MKLITFLIMPQVQLFNNASSSLEFTSKERDTFNNVSNSPLLKKSLTLLITTFNSIGFTSEEHGTFNNVSSSPLLKNPLTLLIIHFNKVSDSLMKSVTLLIMLQLHHV